MSGVFTRCPCLEYLLDVHVWSIYRVSMSEYLLGVNVWSIY